MQRWTYTKDASRLSKLTDALIAAGITPETGLIEVGGLDHTIIIRVDDSVSKSAVDAVVAAYDPTTPSAAEAQWDADQAVVDGLRSDIDATITNWASLSATDKDSAILGAIKALKIALDRQALGL